MPFRNDQTQWLCATIYGPKLKCYHICAAATSRVSLTSARSGPSVLRGFTGATTLDAVRHPPLSCRAIRRCGLDVWVAKRTDCSPCAVGACATWCSDDKSKKVVAVECSGGRLVTLTYTSWCEVALPSLFADSVFLFVSRLFLISPLASPSEIVPRDWIGACLPLRPDGLVGVLARRLTPLASTQDGEPGESRGSTSKRVREAGASANEESEDRAVEPKRRRPQGKKRRTTVQGLLPVTTTLGLDRLDLRSVLADRLANLADAEKDYDDGRPTIKNISVGAALEVFWEEEAWYLAVAQKKTARGILFLYPKEDEVEFIAKQKLHEYTRKEHIRFLQGDVDAQVAAAFAEAAAEADGADGGASGGSKRPKRQRLEPPEDFECGEVEVRVGNKLKSLANDLPSPALLRTWNRECQLAFWAQRRSFWNGKKLSLLQQACRKHGLYPGGDVPDLKDRLLAREFDPALLTEDDTQTEEEAAAKRVAALGASDDSDSDDAPVFTLLTET